MEKIVTEEIIEPSDKTKKTKKKTIKERQMGRIKRYVPQIEEDDISILLDDPYDNREDLRLAVVEHDKDPKEVFNNPIFSKKLIKYINEFKEETFEDINEKIEETKEEISEAVDEILDEKKEELFEVMLQKFEKLVDILSSKIENLDKIKDKYDDMVDDIENKIVEKKKLNTVIDNYNPPINTMDPGLARMLRRY